MLNYDVIVIGSGIAGYSAALRCLEQGLRTAIISSGQSALHFSSGSIDLLSHSPVTHEPVRDPWQEIENLPATLPHHPYARLGIRAVRNGLSWYQSLMDKQGLPMSSLNSQENHYRITTLGTLKSTWLSQPFVKKIDVDFRNTSHIKRIVMISIDGFRDFQPQIAQGNLQHNNAFNDIPVKTAKVTLSAFSRVNRNPHDFRSIDISRILRDDNPFKEFADQLTAVATPDDLVMIPSILGNGDGLELMYKLTQYTKLQFHEVPTMPPSLLGIRIEDTMMHTFISQGGALLKGDQVLGGEFREDNGALTLTHITTKKMAEIGLKARHYVLASGSFFSKGLIAHQKDIEEPIFGLDTSATGERANWHQVGFFSKTPHAFMSFGVTTDNRFLPSVNGRTVNNLFCAGSILSGYNPVAHGCGGGVAISTGYFAAQQILAELRQEMQMKEVRA
ncbi:anaerobic glycerol-3-phosphate dehydrogenase subunit B [Vibrio albus]|uniref:Anaerobic glycerol-3-phosphate dehydrogenase subunit B n=1 Tax=Vibrio albus TaxID=2200953 RepID=A0A2U3B793_9VIBR|nr:glycerol-3-phosphate dehydrogenase subunit GlpB [Vibrio albus]PWI32657.1 anaerobic glycerol-3-phosphate dehydrogenase subunit B [Vibrio albus]